MRAQTLPLILTLLLAPSGPAPAQQDAAARKELAGMAGAWRLASGEENGKPAPEFAVENLRCVIKGDRLTFKGLQPLTDKASTLTIKIDVSTMPRCIDLKVEVGSLKGSVLEGVYERKGDELRMCLHWSGGARNRPLEFKTKAGSNRVLLVLKRENP